VAPEVPAKANRPAGSEAPGNSYEARTAVVIAATGGLDSYRRMPEIAVIEAVCCALLEALMARPEVGGPPRRGQDN